MRVDKSTMPRDTGQAETSSAGLTGRGHFQVNRLCLAVSERQAARFVNGRVEKIGVGPAAGLDVVERDGKVPAWSQRPYLEPTVLVGARSRDVAAGEDPSTAFFGEQHDRVV